jgi:ABC-2 type transport system permease protein
MSAQQESLWQAPTRGGFLRHEWDVLRVIAATEFKLKYTTSALGYVWSIVKPLSYFAVLWVVFGRFFKLGNVFEQYPLYLLLGIVLWTFFADAASLGMVSLVARGTMLRKLSFPRLVIPISATLVAAMTFLINLLVVGVFLVIAREPPRFAWLLIFVLLIELYLFIVGVSLILATLFVRFRDVGQVWELLVQLLFYATPIIYPLGLLPPWARAFAMLNPFTQVMQDIRAIVIENAPANAIMTASDVLGPYGRVWPVLIALTIFVGSILLFRHEEPWFAERV